MNGAPCSAAAEESSTGLRDPTDALPKELVCEVFRKLDFVGRLAVSHVTTLWRVLALSDRRLWAQWQATHVTSGHSRLDTMVAMLAEMLTRSDPLPFSLECGHDVPDPIVEFVIANVQRMEVLRLGQLQTDDALERILAHDVTMLREFSFQPYMHPDMHFSLPARWAAAPFLESLSLGCPCIWPPGCTIPTLTSFAGCVPDSPGPRTSISEMFPNLKNLTLYRLTDALLVHLERLPPTLAVLQLRADDGVDCAALLRNWTTPTLRELKINWASSTECVVDVFRLFARTVSGPWALYSVGCFAILRAPSLAAPTHRFEVLCMTGFWYERAAEILPLCNHLCELKLPLFDLLPLCSAQAVFPALSTVTVKLSEREDTLWAALRDRPRVSAPALRKVAVHVPTCRDLDVRVAEIVVPIVRAFHSPRLASVVIHTHDKQPFPHEDDAALADLATCVEVQDFTGNVSYVYSSATESTSSAGA